LELEFYFTVENPFGVLSSDVGVFGVDIVLAWVIDREFFKDVAV
jgi:hypothetical protein